MIESHNQSALSYPGAHYYKYFYDYHSDLYFESTVLAIHSANFSISNLCIFALGFRLYAMFSFALNIFPPVEMQCVCLTGTEFLNIILHFMLQRAAASRPHQTRWIQFISLQSNSLPCNFVSSFMLLDIIMPLLSQAFLTIFHIFIPSTHYVCPPYYLTTVTLPHQQNVFKLSHVDYFWRSGDRASW